MIIESQNQKKDQDKVKRTVCVHWMQNQCKKGDNCEFLHVYDESKIPPCRFWLKDGFCQKADKCTYLHSKADQGAGAAAMGGAKGAHAKGAKDAGTGATAGAGGRGEECPYYERGFCKLGSFM